MRDADPNRDSEQDLRHYDERAFRLAAANIAVAIGKPRSGSALVVCSPVKKSLAEEVCRELLAVGVSPSLLDLGDASPGHDPESVKARVRQVASSWGVAVLASWRDAEFVFDVVGRPDRGIKLPQEHLYCDFCLSLPGLVRTTGVDLAEVSRFSDCVIRALAGASDGIRVTTSAGTDMTVVPRRWNRASGEVFTAPVEGIASGTIVVDGCAYGGPPKSPFTLRIERGRVVNLNELDREDEQQGMAFTDLTRDGNAAMLAEFGIGVNPGARRDADLMEAEQARGTCHFDFGHNIEYGGANTSCYHFGFVILCPTIAADETDAGTRTIASPARVIARDGRFLI